MPVSSPTKDLIDLKSSPRRGRSLSGDMLGLPKKKSALASAKGTPRKSAAGSKLATPLKNSPVKKGKNEGALLEEISDLPASIIEALASLGISRLSHLKGQSVKAMEDQLTPILFKTPSGEDQARGELAQKMQKELLAAWLRFLSARAEGNLSDNKSSWRDCIDTRCLGSMTAKGMLEAESFLKQLRPNILIRQRSALKKVNKPRSKHIHFADLKQGKNKLVKIPKGETMAKKVNKDILEKAMKTLRQIKK